MQMGNPTQADGSPEHRIGAAVVVAALVLCFLIVGFDLLDGTLYLGDVDDDLRHLQVLQLMNSGDWFDRTLPFISMPEAYVSPWSRLVDLPYAAIGFVLSPILEHEAALRIASLVWPLVMLVGFCLLVLQILRRLVPSDQALELPMVCATLLAMALSIWEFSPGRIDHHNMQLLMSLLSFLGLLLWSRAGAVMAGIAVVLSVAIGLELLPLTALMLGGVAISWVLDRPGSAQFMQAFGFTLFFGAPLVALILLGPVGLVAVECDAFSAPYLVALMGYGLTVAAATSIFGRPGAWMRFFTLAGAGVVLLAGLAVGFSACLAGPYQMIDPLSRSLWLNRLPQELSILFYFEEGSFSHALKFGTMIVIGILAVPMVLRDWRGHGTAKAILLAIALGALLLAAVQTRYIRFPAAFVPLFLPLVLAGARESPRLTGGLALSSALVVGLGAFCLHLLVPVSPRQFVLADFLSSRACEGADFSDLAQLAPGRIMAPMAVGLALAPHLPDGVTIAGIPFHRSSPGIRRIFETFVRLDPQNRREAAGPFDYVALCPFQLPENIPDASVFAVLTRGGNWPGLIRITDPQSQLQLFKIDHTQFR
jgi:hypothetical protein